MKKSTENKPLPTARKRLFQIILFIVYPAYILHSLVVAPIYTVCSSNIGVPEWIHVALYCLLILIDLAVFFISFSVMIYGLCMMPPRNMKNIFILILASPLFKYLLKFLISPFIDGISLDNIIIDLYSYGISGFFEILIYVAVILLSLSGAKKYRDNNLLLEKAQVAGSVKKSIEYVSLIPFKKIISFKNPLQRSALFSALIIIVARVSSLAINDMSQNWKITGINQYLSFFAPYVLECLVGIMGYFLMLYIFIQFYTKTSDK